MFTMEITRLIERCRQGEADALGELYKAYARQMRGVCRRYISDEQTVEDVLHDAFVIIFTSFDRLRDVRRAEPWMTAITRNVASKCKNHLEALPTVSLEDTNEAGLIAAEDEEIGDCKSPQTVRGVPLNEVVRMIDRLPEGYGQVFRLSVFEGMTHKEIADMLGIEPHSSSSQLARAKKMLRKMMQQYWVAGLLLLLVPVTFYLFRKDERPSTGERRVGEQSSGISSRVVATADTVQSAGSEGASDPETNNLVEKVGAAAPLPSRGGAGVGSVIPSPKTSSTNDTAPTPNPSPTREGSGCAVIAQTGSMTVKPSPLNNKGYAERTPGDWHFALAYAGNPQGDLSRTDNYMTMPTLSSSMTRSTKLYNWGDYMDYVMANAPMMDSVSASNMRHVAVINSSHPQDPLTETKHHERPLTMQISLSRQLNSHWSLATGLSYTRMKSTFESGNENTIIHRTQRLHYLGIPLKLGYRMVGGHRWNLYTTGGIQLDIPVSARLTTQYIYGGAYSPDIDANISAPWQWSVGVGIGAQYQIVPHLNVYLEPSLNYFIPTSTDVESYRSEHPFDLSLPFGIRFTW